MLAGTAVALGLAWVLPDGARATASLMGVDLTWLRVDRLSRIFALVFALIGGLGALYGWTASRRFHITAPLATGAALALVLAGDWVTLYLWWETLALASFVLIGDGGPPRAPAAALRYLLVHVAGGACLLGGIAWHVATGGGLAIDRLALDGPGLLVLLAFAVNAAVPPLHAWLTDAYPESSPAGSALLSAFVTKSAVYALARVFPGTEGLVWAGVTMSLYGVTFAVLENDLRRLLGYHIVSQVGYMVTGVGLGTPLGVSGAVAHAFSHILYKGLLFMGAGAVVSATGRRRMSELGGLGRYLPGVAVLYMVGALSISGAPLLNGFVSKTLVVAAAGEAGWPIARLLLILAAVGTFLSVGLKLPWFTFTGADRELRPAPVPRTMVAAMALTAALCFLTGTRPALLYALLPYPVDVVPYTAGHVLEALQLLTGTGVAFVLLRGHLRPKAAVTLDFDRAYRALGRLVGETLAPSVGRSADRLEAAANRLADLPLGTLPARLAGPVGYAVAAAMIILGLALVLLGPAR
jgi:multicomponent Na+:H+ antiporter subunit D